MLRVYSLFALAFGFFCLTAFRAEEPKCNDRPLLTHSTAASSCFDNGVSILTFSTLHNLLDTDTGTVLRILMLDYNTYDSAYANKVRRLIKAQLPASHVSEFWEGSGQELNSALAIHDAVVITYPSGGSAEVNKTYGKLLERYVRQGGTVVFTGTDDYRILQQFGLFNVSYGYFCQDPLIHEIDTEHPVLEGTAEQFPMSDYAYPLDVSDPDFVTLVNVLGYDDENSPTRCWSESDEVSPAELRNFPVIGYKNLGAGKVIYLGMEYYFDQAEPTRILINALRWAAQPKSTSTTTSVAKEVRLNRPVKRSEEVLQAGSGPKQEVFDLKIYPNPYYEKATLDIELKKATTVVVEMTDEKGRIVAVVLPQKNLATGFYRLELPNLPAGVYFVQCKTGEKTTVRKVVKTTTR
jgi:type 1 glutamine amidotransferase